MGSWGAIVYIRKRIYTDSFSLVCASVSRKRNRRERKKNVQNKLTASQEELLCSGYIFINRGVCVDCVQGT